MADENIGEVATGAAVNNSNQEVKTYTQDEVDAMMARTRQSLEKKLLKPYQDLGDPNEVREVLKEHQKRQQEAQLKRGEFEKLLQEQASKFQQELQQRDAIIKDYKINTPLLSSAAKYNAVNAEQVKSLLANHLRLNELGDVEVIDDAGKPRYTDRGEPLKVDDLVQEFMEKNPHFRLATPTTSHTRTSHSLNGIGIDITKLDMKNPADRKIFAQYSGGRK